MLVQNDGVEKSVGSGTWEPDSIIEPELFCSTVFIIREIAVKRFGLGSNNLE